MGEVTTSPIETLEVGLLVGLGSMAEMKKLHQKHFGKGKQTKERTYKTDNGRSYELGALALSELFRANSPNFMIKENSTKFIVTSRMDPEDPEGNWEYAFCLNGGSEIVDKQSGKVSVVHKHVCETSEPSHILKVARLDLLFRMWLEDIYQGILTVETKDSIDVYVVNLTGADRLLVQKSMEVLMEIELLKNSEIILGRLPKVQNELRPLVKTMSDLEIAASFPKHFPEIEHIITDFRVAEKRIVRYLDLEGQLNEDNVVIEILKNQVHSHHALVRKEEITISTDAKLVLGGIADTKVPPKKYRFKHVGSEIPLDGIKKPTESLMVRESLLDCIKKCCHSLINPATHVLAAVANSPFGKTDDSLTDIPVGYITTGKGKSVVKEISFFVEKITDKLEDEGIAVVCVSGDTANFQLLLQDELGNPSNVIGAHLSTYKKRISGSVDDNIEDLITEYLPKFHESESIQLCVPFGVDCTYNTMIPFTYSWRNKQRKDWSEALDSKFPELGDVRMEDVANILRYPKVPDTLPEITVPELPPPTQLKTALKKVLKEIC